MQAHGHPGIRVPSRIIEGWTAKDKKKLDTGRFEMMSGLCLDISGMGRPVLCGDWLVSIFSSVAIQTPITVAQKQP